MFIYTYILSLSHTHRCPHIAGQVTFVDTHETHEKKKDTFMDSLSVSPFLSLSLSHTHHTHTQNGYNHVAGQDTFIDNHFDTHKTKTDIINLLFASLDCTPGRKGMREREREGP